MEIKKEKFDNIDELEFAILQELPKLRILYSLRGEKEEDENNFLKDIYRGINSDCYVDGAFEVLEKIDNGYICSSDEEDKLFLIRDCAEMNIGDLFIYSGSECKKISKEFLDLEKYKNLFNDLDNWEIEKNYYRRTIFAVAEISVEEITFDVVLEKIEEYKKQIIETRIEKEKEQEKREIIEKKEEDKTET